MCRQHHSPPRLHASFPARPQVHLCELRLAALLRVREARRGKMRTTVAEHDEEGERQQPCHLPCAHLVVLSCLPGASDVASVPATCLARQPTSTRSSCPRSGLADASAALLALADDNGLAHLRAVALDFIVHHHEAVARTGGWAGLQGRA